MAGPGKKTGRPAKKPGYDRQAEIDELINTAVAFAVEPFDDEDERDKDLPNMNEIADAMKTTFLKVRKLLITADYFTSQTTRTVHRLDAEGLTIPEIMSKTGLCKASVSSYLPYKKGAYNLPEPTLYAEQGRRYRERKGAVENLREAMDGLDGLDGSDGMDATATSSFLWNAIIAFEGYPFHTSGRGKEKTGSVKFKYEVSREGGDSGRHYAGESVPGYGNELWIITLPESEKKEKSISRSTVDLAFKNGLKLMKADGVVPGPKALGVPGAGSYLYPILIRFGVIVGE